MLSLAWLCFSDTSHILLLEDIPIYSDSRLKSLDNPKVHLMYEGKYSTDTVEI